MRRNLHFAEALLPTGWARDVRITIDGAHIEAVAAGVSAEAGDERHAIALPGVPNLHSHAFQRAMAGHAERRGAHADTFWTWRTAMYRLVKRLDPDAMETIAAMAFVEMLESGFTHVGEFHYVHHNVNGAPYADRAAMAGAVARAVQASGIGLTLLPVLYMQGGFGGIALNDAQRRFTHDVDGYALLLEACAPHLASLEGAVLGAAPHSLRAVSPEALSAVAALQNGPIHLHIAEQLKEVDECIAWSGERPIEWLMRRQNVDARWCLVHATHANEAEIAAMAASGAVVGLCPVTEANLGDGVFPARAYLDAGGRFGIGSDSNVRIDAAEEMRLLEYGQRLMWRVRNVLADENQSVGTSLLSRSLAGGARALGIRVGLEAGAGADFITLRSEAPALAAAAGDAIADCFVFASGKDLIDGVWRAGKQVVSGGRHHAREGVAARFNSVMRALAT